MRHAAEKALVLGGGIRGICAWVTMLSWSLGPALLPAAQTAAARKLQMEVYKGDQMLNEDRIPKDVIVRVTDDQGRPVVGAAVVFQLPFDGAGGAFAEDSRFATVISDSEGLATAKGFQPNTQPGEFRITVTASYRDYQSTTTTVTQSNGEAVAEPDVATERRGSGRAIAIAVVVAGAAAGLAFGLGGGGGTSGPAPPAPPPPIVITPGSPTFGGPQ
ncbi:MAG: Ig-like domain-containing protein [Bryobacterales bacterium]